MKAVDKFGYSGPAAKRAANAAEELAKHPAADLTRTQKAIWSIFLKSLAKALRKNHDYGDSFYQSPPLAPEISSQEAILVRMGDKIKRIQTLGQLRALVADESLNDTIEDLGVYCFLYLIVGELLAENCPKPPKPGK